MTIVINGEAKFEYDRDKPLTEKQHQFLNKMDVQMDAGIVLDDKSIENPDELQRAQFVALNLVQAIYAEDEQRVAAMCSYLANRIPELKQVKATQERQGFLIDLVIDQPHVKEASVNFIPPKPKSH